MKYFVVIGVDKISCVYSCLFVVWEEVSWINYKIEYSLINWKNVIIKGGVFLENFCVKG